MAVAFDVASSASGLSVTSLTTPSFTVGALSNRAAMLCLCERLNTSSAYSGSLGGVAAVVTTGSDSGVSFSRRTQIWELKNPPSGSQTATMSWTGAENAELGVIVASGVDQADILNNATFTGLEAAGNPSLSITSTSGDLTIDCVRLGGASVLSAPTQTQQWFIPDITGGSTGPGTGTTVHAWTATSNTMWVQSGANFRQAADILFAQACM